MHASLIKWWLPQKQTPGNNMVSSAIFWLFLNLLTILVLAFYSMVEMACVSFNKVRLQYYVFKGNKRAEWLNWLLHNPNRLFGTTLVGVNVATVFGSEFARKFYEAIGLDPALSPLTQVLLVVILGELAPMFAARRYAEHVAMMGIPIVYASAKIVAPIIWAVTAISRLFNKFIGGKETHGNIFITQDELLKIIEGQDEEKVAGESAEFNAITTNIFNLRNKDVRQVMEPLTDISLVPSNATIFQTAEVLRQQKIESDYVLIYHRKVTNVVAVAHSRDLVRASENRRVRDYSKSPWFVTENSNVLKVLKQFRNNNESLAVVLNEQGKASGVIQLEDIVEEIFGKRIVWNAKESDALFFLDRSFPGSMTVREFNALFDVQLDKRGDWTLSEFLMNRFEHHPEVGESIFIDPFELTVKETSLLEIKTVHIKTILK
jgi:putative hemolysin